MGKFILGLLFLSLARAAFPPCKTLPCRYCAFDQMLRKCPEYCRVDCPAKILEWLIRWRAHRTTPQPVLEEEYTDEYEPLLTPFERYKKRERELLRRTTKKPTPKPGNRPCISREEADERFLGCCKEKSLGSRCLRLCHYGLSKHQFHVELEAVFLQGGCDDAGLYSVFECAANNRNAEQCCFRKGVFAGEAGESCRPLCRPPMGGSSVDLTEYSHCLRHVPSITACLHAAQLPTLGQ